MTYYQSQDGSIGDLKETRFFKNGKQIGKTIIYPIKN